MKKQLFRYLLLVAIPFFPSCEDDAQTADARDEIARTWRVEESTGSMYDVTVSKSLTDATQVQISNFANEQANATAIYENKVLTFEQQVVGEITVKSGTGTVSANNQGISLTYVFEFDGQEETVTATFTPQDNVAK